MFLENILLYHQGRRGSNADADHHMKRSQSVSQQLGGKHSSDLLGLNLFNPSSTPSSASTPTGGHPYAPLQSPPPLSSPPTSQPAGSNPSPHSHTAGPAHPHPRFQGELIDNRQNPFKDKHTDSGLITKSKFRTCVLYHPDFLIYN